MNRSDMPNNKKRQAKARVAPRADGAVSKPIKVKGNPPQRDTNMLVRRTIRVELELAGQSTGDITVGKLVTKDAADYGVTTGPRFMFGVRVRAARAWGQLGSTALEVEFANNSSGGRSVKDYGTATGLPSVGYVWNPRDWIQVAPTSTATNVICSIIGQENTTVVVDLDVEMW